MKKKIDKEKRENIEAIILCSLFGIACILSALYIGLHFWE